MTLFLVENKFAELSFEIKSLIHHVTSWLFFKPRASSLRRVEWPIKTLPSLSLPLPFSWTADAFTCISHQVILQTTAALTLISPLVEFMHAQTHKILRVFKTFSQQNKSFTQVFFFPPNDKEQA